MIGIIAPLAQEAAVFKPQHRRLKEVIQLSDNMLLVISGVGESNAVEAANILAPRVTHLISWGTAAGLMASVGAGTLLLPRSVMSDAGEKFTTDDLTVEKILASIPENVLYNTNHICQSTSILEDKGAKEKFHKLTGAVACDMESAAIAAFAQKNNLKFNAIRFVTDDLNTTIPKEVHEALDTEGEMNYSKLFLGILKSPQSIGSLIKLGKCFSLAQRTMKPTSILISALSET